MYTSVPRFYSFFIHTLSINIWLLWFSLQLGYFCLGIKGLGIKHFAPRAAITTLSLQCLSLTMRSMGVHLSMCLQSYWFCKVPHRAAHLSGAHQGMGTYVRNDPCCSLALYLVASTAKNTLKLPWHFCCLTLQIRMMSVLVSMFRHPFVF